MKRMVRLVLGIGVLAALSAWLGGGVFGGPGPAAPEQTSGQQVRQQARADDGADASPTPVATVVTPTVATVEPVEQVVTPITGMAEATTESAQLIGSDDGGSGNLFAGVRGGLIGAGIALGVVVVATVVVRGVTARRKQRHQ